jgi:hypothetical protein
LLISRHVLRVSAFMGDADHWSTSRLAGMMGQRASAHPEGGSEVSAKRETDDHQGVDNSQPEPLRLVRRKRPKIVAVQEFMKKDLPPLQQVVPGLLLEGAILVAGAPKAGKSRLALSLAVAVATGRPALGKIPVKQRDVLYLCLEDGERMTQDRIRALQDDDPGSLFMSFKDWPRLGEGCEIEIESWLQEHPNAGLVVIDTLQRIRPETKAYQSVYSNDYAACSPLADLAHKHRICILIVHHTRKTRKEDQGDPMEMVSGSTGLTGAVEGTLLLKRKRHETDGTLQLLHREVPDTSYRLTTDAETGIWTLVGEVPEAEEDDEADDAPVTSEQRLYIDLIREHGQMRAREIEPALGKSYDTVRKMLRKLVKRHLLDSSGGVYWVAEAQPISEDVSEPGGMATEVPDSPVHTVHGGHTVHVDDGVHTVHSDHISGPEHTVDGASSVHSGLGVHSDPGVHSEAGVHTPSGSTAPDCEQCELVNTPSDIEAVVPKANPDDHRVTSAPGEREQVAAEDDIRVLSGPVPADEDRASKLRTPDGAPPSPDAAPRTTRAAITNAARACGDYGPEHEPGRRTPTSDIPFERGWRNPLVLDPNAVNTSERLDWDTGCRTEVKVEVKLTGEPPEDSPQDKTVWLRCGHGRIGEEVEYEPFAATRTLRALDDEMLIRMALAHHAYMIACDCIRPLWNQHYNEPLTRMSAELALWSAHHMMDIPGYRIRAWFYAPGPKPAPRWVVKPETTWDESEEYWPEEDE